MQVSRIHRKHGPHPTDNGTVIDILFIHPDHHRRGVGRELVAQARAKADERGLPSIVEASPAGKRTYELNSFVNKERITITHDDWPGKGDNLYYWMERPVPESA